MKIKCPAKVNIFLNTVKKNENGFHELESIFHTVDVCDYLTIEKSDEFSLSFSPQSSFPVVSDDYDLTKNNFIEQVYLKFKSDFNLPSVKIQIEKHIPVGAGLGGGSSDTAGCISGLNQLFDLNLSEEKQHKIAEFFGSDTPFFLNGGMAFVTGRGEIIEPAPKPLSGELVIVFPDLPISTAFAYNQNNFLYNPETDANPFNIPNFKELKNKIFEIHRGHHQDDNKVNHQVIELLSRSSYNSFQTKTIERYPEIKSIFEKLQKFETNPLLSGSGSSIFAAYHDKIISEKIFELLKKEFKHVFNTTWLQHGVKVV